MGPGGDFVTELSPTPDSGRKTQYDKRKSSDSHWWRRWFGLSVSHTDASHDETPPGTTPKRDIIEIAPGVRTVALLSSALR